MNGQMTIFDWMPTAQQEPDVGAWVEKPGAVIPHIMIPSYIGKKVCIDCSTQSHKWYQIGVLEKAIPDKYYHWDGNEYQERDCDRVIIYTGKKQRSYISLMPGTEIYEPLPWDAYPERMAAIGKQ